VVSLRDHDQLVNAVSALSRGSVVGIRASGPLLDRCLIVLRRPQRGTFVPVLRTSDRMLVALMSIGWLTCLVLFWRWWLEPAHRVTWVGLGVNSTVLLYLSVMPVYFMVGVNRLKRVDPRIDVPGLRVAFVVTRAPSEPWETVRATLVAMLCQRFPHPFDVWLCDESPTEEIRNWCGIYGVQLSTRFEMETYHRATWPRRTRCKEGNLAYFYDHGGYENYDVVAQLDCDHVPEPDYLTEMVRPFADSAIGYVAAPSVCDANAGLSWAARGRLHREATFHGPAQLGHSAGLGPVCIGSHYAVRTNALRDIGGIGPELAEDFSTSFLLNSAGWQGAFAIDAEAHGDGPLTFSAMLVQEFQWSRSLTTVLLGLVPRHLPRLPWKLRLRFLYALIFYVLLAGTTVGGLALAPIAAITGAPWINVNYAVFLLFWWSISVWVLALTLLLRRRGLLRPRRAPILSWENNLYCLTRWPFIAWGVSAAFVQWIRPRQITFKVTPKSVGGMEPLPLRLVMPYVLTNLLLAGSSLYAEHFTKAAGYAFLCLLGATTYTIVALAVPLLHAKEMARAAGTRFRVAARQTADVPLLVATLAAVPVAVAIARYPAYFSAVFGR
jgi:cellulose synthase/poly-beta-1,6-N-acetylglucosamine synthase-like glycosyltransferase